MIDIQAVIPQLRYCTDDELAELLDAVNAEQGGRSSHPRIISDEKSSFAIGDAVGFFHKGRRISGTITKFNPKRAGVDVDGRYWLVPYSILQKK